MREIASTSLIKLPPPKEETPFSSAVITQLLLVSISILFIFCLPFNQLNLPLDGIRHPSITVSLLLFVFILFLAIKDVMLQRRFRLTPFTNQLFLLAGLCLIPLGYLRSELDDAISYASSLGLSLLLLFSLHQFRFNSQLRQVLLYIPMMSGWLIAAMLLLSLSKESTDSVAALLRQFSRFEQSYGVLLLTAFALSAYLLARIPRNKYQYIVATFLLTSPLIYLVALAILPNGTYISLSLIVVLCAQPFLFRNTPRMLQALWLLSTLIGIGFCLLPLANIGAPYFSSLDWLNLNHTLQLIANNLMAGVGVGRLSQELLLLNAQQGTLLTILEVPPSWALAKIAEGGMLLTLVGILFTLLLFKRLRHAPIGSRLMLFAILLPSIFSVFATGFTLLNPMLPLLFIILLYWLDNLAMPYQHINVTIPSVANPILHGVMIAYLIVVSSSLYLSTQVLQQTQFSTKKLIQYQYHPWWTQFFYQQWLAREFTLSVSENDFEKQFQILQANKKQLADAPNAAGYQALIEQALQTKNLALAEQSLREARQLYPSHPFFLH